MKKAIILVITFFIISGCAKNNQELIIGKWKEVEQKKSSGDEYYLIFSKNKILIQHYIMIMEHNFVNKNNNIEHKTTTYDCIIKENKLIITERDKTGEHIIATGEMELISLNENELILKPANGIVRYQRVKK